MGFVFCDNETLMTTPMRILYGICFWLNCFYDDTVQFRRQFLWWQNFSAVAFYDISVITILKYIVVRMSPIKTLLWGQRLWWDHYKTIAYQDISIRTSPFRISLWGSRLTEYFYEDVFFQEISRRTSPIRTLLWRRHLSGHFYQSVTY